MAEAIKMGGGGGKIKNAIVEKLYAADEDIKPNTFCNLVTGSLSEDTFASGEKALSSSYMYNIDLGNNKILFYTIPTSSSSRVYLRVLDTNTGTFGTTLQIGANVLNALFVRNDGNTIDLFTSLSSRSLYINTIQVDGLTLTTTSQIIVDDGNYTTTLNTSIRSLYELSGIPAYVVFYATSSGSTTTTYYLYAKLVSCVTTPTVKKSLLIFSATSSYINVNPESVLEQLQIIKCNNRYFLFTHMTTNKNTNNLNTALYEIITSTYDVTDIKRLSSQQTNAAWGTSGRSRLTERACNFYKVLNNNIFFAFIINYEDYNGDDQDGGYVEVLIDTESGTYTLQNQSFPTGVYGYITAFDKINDNYLCISNSCANVNNKSLFVCTIDTTKTTGFVTFSSPVIVPTGMEYTNLFTISSVCLLQNLYSQDYYWFTAPYSSTSLAGALVKVSNNIVTLIGFSTRIPTLSGSITTDMRILDYKYTPKHFRRQVGYCQYTYLGRGINIADDVILFLMQTQSSLNAYKSALVCQKIKIQDNSIMSFFTSLRVLNSNMMTLTSGLGGAFAYEKNTSNVFTYSSTSSITTDYTYNIKLSRVCVAVKKTFDLLSVMVLPYTKCTTTKKGKVYLPIIDE